MATAHTCTETPEIRRYEQSLPMLPTFRTLADSLFPLQATHGQAHISDFTKSHKIIVTRTGAPCPDLAAQGLCAVPLVSRLSLVAADNLDQVGGHDEGKKRALPEGAQGSERGRQVKLPATRGLAAERDIQRQTPTKILGRTWIASWRRHDMDLELRWIASWRRRGRNLVSCLRLTSESDRERW